MLSKLSVSAAALVAWLLPHATQAQERSSADALRRACAAWQDISPAPIFSVPIRLPGLHYEEGVLATALGDRVPVEDAGRGTMDLVPEEAVDINSDASVRDAARLMRAQAEGKLQGQLFFQMTPGRMTGTPCMQVAGGTRISIIPLALSLQRDGHEQLRLFTEQGAVVIPQGKPELQIAAKYLIFDGDDQDRPAIQEALTALSPRAGVCYEQALLRKPDLVGRLVLGLELDRDGRGSNCRTEVDATGEAKLLRCLSDLFGALQVSRLRRPGHLSVPILLQRLAGTVPTAR